MKLDFKVIEKMVQEKYISVQKHPTLPLRIFNYTQKAQFARVWTPEIMACRGLIVNDHDEIVARPFSKFFNYSEHIDLGKELPNEEFEVFDKWDGSLGILYWNGEYPNISTRGSFTSDQAIEGTNILLEKVENYGTGIFDTNYTYLFEIIYPSNRIVVDYKGMRDLVLLSIINTKTGEEAPYEEIVSTWSKIFPIAKRYDGVKDINKIKEMGRDDQEGFVIRFKSGLRLKIKMDEYVRLHRIVTGVTSKNIWELMKNHKDLNTDPLGEYMQLVPEEFLDWVKGVQKSILDKRFELQKWATETMFKISIELNFIFGDGTKLDMRGPMRKEFALRALKTEHPQLLFALLDNREYDDILWKMVKPEMEKPFKKDIDV